MAWFEIKYNQALKGFFILEYGGIKSAYKGNTRL